MNTTNLTPLDHFYHKVKNHFVLDDDARKDLEILYKDAKKMEAWNAEIREKLEQIEAKETFPNR